MFKIEKIVNQSHREIIVSNAENTIKANIVLTQGGRLKYLDYNNQLVISDPEDKSYEESFAAAILFPFANRIFEATYSIKDQIYVLDQNEKGQKNAIHGLIYNKTFELVEQSTTEDTAEVSLEYLEHQPHLGFPFPYAIRLNYFITKTSISLSLSVKNIGKTSFPFTVGWHPYFKSNDIDSSYIELKSDRKIIHNPDQIGIGTSGHVNYKIKLADVSLDDCYVLKSRPVNFTTPLYRAEIYSDQRHKYLQVYKPLNSDNVAIEPMTGISDSFNHKLGVQVLEPNAVYNTTWKINLY